MQQDSIFSYMYDDLKFVKDEITLFESFAGIGSQVKALKRLSKEFGFKLKTIGISEIDKHAINSYNAINGETNNFGSITDILDIPQTDIFTYSFPCQDISLAGKQRGFSKGDGTRSGLLWEVERLLENQHKLNKLPKVLLMENVKALAGQKFVNDFNKWQLKLEELGYKNYWQILNSKHYGIPQNRERVFMISVLGEYNYNFPKPFELKLRLKDMLEDYVDEKYYLTDKQIKQITNWKSQQNPLENAAYQDTEYLQRITAKSNTSMNASMLLLKESTKKGYSEAKDGDGVYINRPHQKCGVVQDGMIPTLKTSPDISVVVDNAKGIFLDQLSRGKAHIENEEISTTLKAQNGHNGVVVKTWNKETKEYKTKEKDMPRDRIYLEESVGFTVTTNESQQPMILSNLRIRKLTPLECWRLMGFDDEDFYKAEKVCSNTQLYKQAGNSIVVDVLYHIFKQLF